MFDQKIRKSWRDTEWKRFLWQLFAVAIVVLLVMLILLGCTVMRGSAMHPSLYDGDLLLFWRLASYEKGDVVLLTSDSGGDTAARIVASAGDVIDSDAEGMLTVNGELLLTQDGSTVPKAARASVTYPLKLGENQFFILGENIEESYDSRYYRVGVLRKSDFRGKLLVTFRFGGSISAQE